MRTKSFGRLIAFGMAMLVALPAAADCGDYCGDDCGTTVCGTSCCSTGTGGVYGGVQYLLLAPKVNSDGFRRMFYDGVDYTNVETDGAFEDDLNGGVRFIAGKETCCGFGGRVRYFTYDNNIGYTGLYETTTPSATYNVVGQSNIDVDALDLELTQRMNCCCWDVILGGGLRYGSVDIMQPPGFYGGIPAILNNGLTGVQFDGYGPTFSVGASRCLGHGLSVVGQARTALLFGDIDVISAYRANPRTIQDEFTQVWEFQLGLNYQTCIRGHNVTGGVFWEAQRWDSDSNFIGDLALHGLGFSGGVSF